MDGGTAIEEAVRDLVRSRAPLARDRADLPDELPLGAGGLGLDSISLVELLLDCQRRFGIPRPVELLEGPPDSWPYRLPCARRDRAMIGPWVFDALERGLAGGAPRQALPVAAALGQVRNRLSRRWPSPEQVQSVFPHFGRSAAARIAWRIGGLEARNRVLVAGIQRAGPEPVRPLVRCSEAFATLRPPLLLGTFHVGAVHALGLALDQLPGPVLALRQGGALAAPRPTVEVATTEGEAQSRAALFHRALLHLERGGFVVLALDVAPGPALRVPCLGRMVPLARGPFALARLTGTPLVPLVARWRSGEAEVVVGEALAPDLPRESAGRPDAWEEALATAAARWLERYLLDAPTELGLGLLRSLLGLDLRPETDGS